MDLSPFERYRPLIDDWSAFAEALARPLPQVVWANTLNIDPPGLAERLARDGIEASPLPWHPGAFRLPAGARPGKTLAYVSGRYHVQEEVSLIPIALLDPRPGESLLDLCAAPGNKTVQAAVQMEDRGTVIANEKNRHRIGVLRRNLARLGVTSAAILHADAANLPATVGVYDRVLADVPCSCEGTTRKNPEVLHRLLRTRPGARSGGQLAILRKAIERVRPGGRVVYSTCSYAPEENEAVVAALLHGAEPGSLRLLPARIEGLQSSPGLNRWRGKRFGEQLEKAMRVWPHHNDTGGFFVAVIEKSADATDKRPGQPPREVAEVVEEVDPEPYLAVLQERFGIPRSLFEGHLVFRKKNGRKTAGRLGIVRRDLRLPRRPEPLAVGIPFFHAGMKYPRPTSAAAVAFGHHARRNLLDLDDRRVMDFVFGREIRIDEALIDGPGYVLGRHRGDVIGLGVCRHRDGALVARGMVPKAWASQIDDVGP
ncbi:MAG: RNA methyltransferase [bacterium]|nr:RNA methyltransferase [bacterium]